MSENAHRRRYLPQNARAAHLAAYQPDEGRMEVDIILSGIERQVYDIYREAAIEAREKAERFLQEFQEEDERRRQMVADGRMSAEDYRNWRISHMAQGRRWRTLADTLARDMTNHNIISTSIIRGHIPEAYAIGYNYGLYSGESQAGVDTPFTLYDRQTVEWLIRDNPMLIKPPNPDVDIPKDLIWNQRVLSSQITQAILLGETTQEITVRLSDKFASMTEVQARRTARTAMTSAENGGRLQSYRDLQSAGIKMKKTWIATLDSVTRESHRWLDNETVDIDDEFSNGLMYPADPGGDPAEVYNCRCTMITQVVDADVMRGTRRSGTIDGMTYEEWKRAKREKEEKKKDGDKAKRKPNPDNPAY